MSVWHLPCDVVAVFKVEPLCVGCLIQNYAHLHPSVDRLIHTIRRELESTSRREEERGKDTGMANKRTTSLWPQ